MRLPRPTFSRTATVAVGAVGLAGVWLAAGAVSRPAPPVLGSDPVRVEAPSTDAGAARPDRPATAPPSSGAPRAPTVTGAGAVGSPAPPPAGADDVDDAADDVADDTVDGNDTDLDPAGATDDDLPDDGDTERPGD